MLSLLECYQKCWLEAVGTVVLLAGVLLLAAGLVNMAPFRITRSFSPFEHLFLSSETKFLCFSPSNLVLSGAINTFVTRSDKTSLIAQKHACSLNLVYLLLHMS